MRDFLNIIVLSFLTMFLTSCSSKSSKKQAPIKTPTPIKIAKIKKPYIFKNLITDLKINCMAVTVDKNNTKTDNYISINQYSNYIKIELNTKIDFPNDYFRLSKEAEDKLSCMAPIIQKEKKLVIQVIGYAKAPDEQHLCDDRAITVAELLFNKGVRHEIYAKGCLVETKPSSKGLSVFIYKENLSLKNHCKL